MRNFWPNGTVQALRGVPLEKVLAWCGAQRDQADRKKWHTLKGSLSVQGVKFMNWSVGVGGGGAIDLVMHLRALGFKRAVDWLAQHCGAVSPAPLVPTATTLVALQLPAPDPSQLKRVRDYLIRQRGLPLALLEPLIDSGTLYRRANAVFLLRGERNLPVGAELRGTLGRCWRGLAPGSRKDLGFFGLVAQAPGALILCESAIDALSCRALHPEHGCVSTAGARPNPRWLASLLNQGREIYCGFDSDATGEQMAQAMIALHPAIRRLRPAAPDWNEQLQNQRRLWSTPGSRLLKSRAITTWKEEPAPWPAHPLRKPNKPVDLCMQK